MKAKISFRARWVLPMDSPPLDGGVITIAGGRIASVGRQATHSGPVEDLGDVVLMPGLVNAHTHWEFSHLQQPLGTPGMTLPEWIRLVIADRNRSGRDAAAAIALGRQESLRQGVTTVGEIATAPPTAYQTEHAPQLIAFQEVIGFSAARTTSVMADAEQRLENCGASVRPGVSPHAPYTVHSQLFAQLVELAIAKKIPVAMHLAESREELQLLASNDGPLRDLLEERSMWDAEAIVPGSRPLDYLKVLSLARRALVIHGNYLEPDEIRFLAEHRERMTVVYCPRTHAFFGHAPYPLQEMLAAGVRVVLGTDSRASNPDLSLLDEMRYVYRHYSGIRAEDVLAMGMSASASALGLDKEVGTITPGKQANLITVPCNVHSSPAEDILQSDNFLSGTWLQGKLA